MDGMREKVEKFIREYHMLEPESRVVVGVSGGPDSLCLLDVLCGIRKDWSIELSAVHIHHGLRGENADRDEEHVRVFCETRGVLCRVYHEQVGRLAREQKRSIEETGRDVRYRRFEEWLKEWGGTHIAVAHHRDDQAETVLFSLARGSGLRGAGGIRPVNGRIVRPLLCVGRGEIEAYLTVRGISWCVDETNAGTDYARNRIRHQVLPLMEAHINSRVSAHLAAAALEFQEAEDYVAAEEQRLYNRYVSEISEGMAVSEKLLEEAPFLQRRVLYRVLKAAAGSARDLSREHVGLLLGILSGACGRQVDMPYSVAAWKEAGRLVVVPQNRGSGCGPASLWPGNRQERRRFQSEEGPGDAPMGKNQGRGVYVCLPLPVPGAVRVGKQCLTLRILDGNTGNFPEKKYTKWLDYDRMSDKLVLRRRQPGDRITIDSMGHHKKLKDFLIDRKIPRHERDSLWLVADGREIVWIIGERMGASYRVSETSSRILEMKFTGDEEDE